MVIKKNLCSITPFLITVLIAACSHGQNDDSIFAKAFKGTELIPSEVNRLCVVEITNESTLDELPGMLKTEMKRRINTGGRLFMTDDINICDAKIRITLLPVISEPMKFNAAGIPEERRIRVDALVTMEHSSTGTEVIRNRDTYADHTYRVTGKDAVSDYRGITGLTEKLAGRIISVITTGWFKEDNLKRSGRQN
jgi:hypothetical protein